MWRRFQQAAPAKRVAAWWCEPWEHDRLIGSQSRFAFGKVRRRVRPPLVEQHYVTSVYILCWVDSPHLPSVVHRRVCLRWRRRIGDHFSRLLRRSNYEQDTSDEQGFPIDLTVTRILFYGKYLSQLHTGSTGEIELTGDFSVRLGPDDLLAGKSETTLPERIEIQGDGVQHVLTV